MGKVVYHVSGLWVLTSVKLLLSVLLSLSLSCTSVTKVEKNRKRKFQVNFLILKIVKFCLFHSYYHNKQNRTIFFLYEPP